MEVVICMSPLPKNSSHIELSLESSLVSLQHYNTMTLNWIYVYHLLEVFSFIILDASLSLLQHLTIYSLLHNDGSELFVATWLFIISKICIHHNIGCVTHTWLSSIYTHSSTTVLWKMICIVCFDCTKMMRCLKATKRPTRMLLKPLKNLLWISDLWSTSTCMLQHIEIDVGLKYHIKCNLALLYFLINSFSKSLRDLASGSYLCGF